MTGNGDSRALGDAPTLPGTAPRGLMPSVAAQGRGSPEGLAYRGPAACAAAGITYRQLDYWARTGLLQPSVRAGGQRLYGVRDVLVLKVVKRLLDAGVSLASIRTAARALSSAELGELAGMTLMSDGASVYRCVSPEELADLLRGGRGVFGIAVGAVWAEVERVLARLPAERVGAGEPDPVDHPADELARRRRRIG